MTKGFFIFMYIFFSVIDAILIYYILKKTLFLLEYNRNGEGFKIIKPDKSVIIASLFNIILIILQTLDEYLSASSSYFGPKTPLGYYLLLIGFFLLLCFLCISSEFFPTIVTSEYIYWKCDSIYPKEKVTFHYNSEEITITCGEKKLKLKNHEKYYELLRLLDTFFDTPHD